LAGASAPDAEASSFLQQAGSCWEDTAHPGAERRGAGRSSRRRRAEAAGGVCSAARRPQCRPRGAPDGGGPGLAGGHGAAEHDFRQHGRGAAEHPGVRLPVSAGHVRLHREPDGGGARGGAGPGGRAERAERACAGRREVGSPGGPGGAHAGGPRPGRCGRRLPRQRGCDMPGAVRAVGRGRGRASRGWEGGRAVRGLYARLGPVRRRGVWHVRRGGELHGPSAAAAAGDGLGGSAVRGLARECGAGGRVRGHPAAGVQRDGGPVRRGFQPVHGDGWGVQRGGRPFVIQVRTGGAVAER